MNEYAAHLRRLLQNFSHVIRLAFLGVLALVLLIPVSHIRDLVAERRERNESAAKEVTSKWGGPQILTGPALILPYTEVVPANGGGTGHSASTVVRHAVFLPKRVKASGVIAMETRERGIFSVPVYNLSITFEGEFERPNIEKLGIAASAVVWSQAHLAVGISDVRALRTQSNLNWHGKETGFVPGTGGFTESPQGLHAPIAVAGSDSNFTFSFPLSVNGSQSVYVVPFAEESVVSLNSNSTFPNFQGNWLPTERSISDAGFDATWRISYLGRNYPQMWTSGTDLRKAIEGSRFGVELNDPIDRYRIADRSVKYAGLFIILTFASVWLVEVLAGAAVHAVQYLMLGAALCVFYLLELSLSEHIGFSLAYGLASVAIVGMVAIYGRTIFRRGQKGVAVPAGVGLLYSYLYVLLTNEDAALVVGSVGLFLILAAIMYITRGVNWHATPGESASASESTQAM